MKAHMLVNGKLKLVTVQTTTGALAPGSRCGVPQGKKPQLSSTWAADWAEEQAKQK